MHEVPTDEILIEVGSASYGLGNRWVIDWERFYDILDTQYDLDMQDLGGTVDNTIRRRVRFLVREGDIG